ncbi:hypothetical protein [Bradyrhizobium valentinum]|uniref:hypothetical protein n=1 Tax=Bradyrhizobium valentinum TaxID=1518501 RepID=UPI000AE7C720|nr:hypothetical protein [Bradyrhizobium valentinum]
MPVADLKLREQAPYLGSCNRGAKMRGPGGSDGNQWQCRGLGLDETLSGHRLRPRAQPRNLLSPTYLWMLRDILTFNQQSIEDYAAVKLAGLTLGEYFRTRHFAPRLLIDLRRSTGRRCGSG